MSEVTVPTTSQQSKQITKRDQFKINSKKKTIYNPTKERFFFPLTNKGKVKEAPECLQIFINHAPKNIKIHLQLNVTHTRITQKPNFYLKYHSKK